MARFGKSGRRPSSYTLEHAANAGVLTGVVGAADGNRVGARDGRCVVGAAVGVVVGDRDGCCVVGDADGSRDGGRDGS